MLARLIRFPVVLLAIAMQGPSPIFAETMGFPKYGEQPSSALFQQLPQWRLIAKQLRTEAEIIEPCRSSGDCTHPVARRIAIFLEEISSESRRQQVTRVHDFVNRQPYREDQRQFGRLDVWLSPLSFGVQGGDCEDYAIAKYFLLSLLGFNDNDMRIVVMTKRRPAQVHAVLLVQLDEASLVLDNRQTEPRSVFDYGDWVPQYAVSAAQAWRYVPDKASVQISANPRTMPISPAAGRSFPRTVPDK